MLVESTLQVELMVGYLLLLLGDLSLSLSLLSSLLH